MSLPSVVLPDPGGHQKTIELSLLLRAYPAYSGVGVYRAEPNIERLRDEGLGGLETYYPTHSPEQQAYFAAEAARLGMIATGGADFHGDPGRQPDLGGQPMPDRVLDDVRRAAGR